MNLQFTPSQVLLTDLFAKDKVYVIPPYQRPYSWDCIGKSDKNNQVNVMWQDLVDCYETKSSEIYFLGSMVLIQKENQRTYEVVDGQQRLTTLTILLVSIKCFLRKINTKDGLDNKTIQASHKPFLNTFINQAIEEIDSLIFNKEIFGALVQNKKVKIERGAAGFDSDSVLNQVMECTEFDAYQIKNATSEQKTVTERFFKNRKFLTEKLYEKFTNSEVFTYDTANELNNFIAFLKNKVTVVQILATGFEVAYQIFEILNNRGLPLSNKDLFRNFLINQFQILKTSDPDKYARLDPNEKWRYLDDNFDLNSEFISRYVETKKGHNQKLSAFNDLLEIFKDFNSNIIGQSKVETFYDEIKTYLGVYTKIVNTDFENKRIVNSLKFLLNSGNTTYTINLLLSLFENVRDEDKILLFLNEFERYTVFNLLSPSGRFASKPIYNAINFLNSFNINNALKEFSLDKSQKNELKKYLDGQIKDNELAKLMIAKYLWASDNSDDVVNQILDYDRATLEHITPQNPDAATNWTKDFDKNFREKYTYRLGNMTLLTQKMNSAAKNYGFDEKKKVYDQTKLFLTKSVADLPKITPKFIEERQNLIVERLILSFNIQ